MDACLHTIGSCLLTLGIPKPGCLQGQCFARLPHGPFCIILGVHAFALFCAFLYLTAFTAMMFVSCVSQLGFFAYNCFRELLLTIRALLLAIEGASSYSLWPLATDPCSCQDAKARQKDATKTCRRANQM